MRKPDEELFEAVETGNLSKVKELLNHPNLFKRANIEAKHELTQEHPLSRAVMFNKVDIIEYLIEKGADIEAKNLYGQTAFAADISTYICEKENKSLHCLIQYGANLETTDKKGKTPLLEATRYGHVNALKFLFQHGVNVNAQDNDGNTALMLAILNKNEKELNAEEKVNLLLQNGVDFYIKNNKGSSPFDWAIQNPNEKISRLIIIKHQENIKNITPEELAEIHQNNQELLQNLLISGKLLKSLKKQSYEHQREAYKIIKNMLSPQSKKEFEFCIREKRLKREKEQ